MRLSARVNLIALLVCVTSAGQVFARQVASDGSSDLPMLTVNGRGEIEMPPDELTLTLSVVSESKAAADAADENSRKSNEIVQALNAVGLEDGAVTTRHYSILPRYSDGSRPKILGYRASKSIVVKTKRIESAGQLVEAAVEAGVTMIQGVHFGLADRHAGRALAIAEAVSDAKNSADALAGNSGLRLMHIQRINVDGAEIERPRVTMRGPYPQLTRESLQSTLAGEESPEFLPMPITVSASVTIQYRVEPAR